jgi:hypothetical protein
MKQGSVDMSKVKPPPLEKWVHYNSTTGSMVRVNYGDPKPWVARIMTIDFTPADGPWQNPSAFLLIQTQTNYSYSVNTSCTGTKPPGLLIPLSTPTNGTWGTKVYYRGTHTGEDVMSFSILDCTYAEVPLSILMLTMHIAEESVIFLTN